VYGIKKTEKEAKNERALEPWRERERERCIMVK
jgi:hypothetical protein